MFSIADPEIDQSQNEEHKRIKMASEIKARPIFSKKYQVNTQKASKSFINHYTVVKSASNQAIIPQELLDIAEAFAATF